ncbi:MAG TPA: DUF2490 domain-containing protein [Candidatus Obscuribacterales bacterium]
MRALLILLTLLLLAPAARAGSAEHAFQMWTPVFVDVPILKPRVRGYFEVNPRLNDGLDGMSQLLVRPALGYRFNQHVATYAGYAWITNYPTGFFQEQRIWQQLGLGFTAFRCGVLNRMRLEQRLIEHTDGAAAVRYRHMIRLAVPLFQTRWYLVGFDELFINFNSVSNAVQSGIDQNRIYVGLGRQISRNLRTEVAYQQQYVNRRDVADDKANHILMTSLFIDF